MKLVRFTSSLRPLALAAFGLATLAAQAAPGYLITKDQENQVQPGMSASDVRATLGRPEADVRYANEPGPTFTYRVAGDNDSLYDVDFGSDGRVLAAGEHMNYTGGGGNGSHHGGR